jgi:hypothetical protein
MRLLYGLSGAGPSLSHTCTYPLSATVCRLYLANVRTPGPALRIYAYAVISVGGQFVVP